jgi:predicted PurR-regulated permease PerM
MTDQPRDLTRTTLAVLFTGMLILGAFLIVRPFLSSFVWAAMIVVATWPIMHRLERRLWNRRWLAVGAMTLALVLLFVLPLMLAVSTIIEHGDTIVGWVKSLSRATLPALPEWVQRIPMAGPRIASTWQELGKGGGQGMVARIAPQVGDVFGWLIAQAGSLGMLLVQALLTLLISALLYFNGETAVAGCLAFARRLGGDRGDRALEVAGRAIRGVALGVVVTAILQALLAGLGLVVAGVPLAGLLTVVTFVLAVAQIGALPVLLPAVLWLYWQDDTTWAMVLGIWTVVVVNIDNVVRPILIQRGAKLPLMLIFVGVIGGLIAFGLVGIFVGPVVLAVSYELLVAWVRQGMPDAPLPAIDVIAPSGSLAATAERTVPASGSPPAA